MTIRSLSLRLCVFGVFIFLSQGAVGEIPPAGYPTTPDFPMATNTNFFRIQPGTTGSAGNSALHAVFPAGSPIQLMNATLSLGPLDQMGQLQTSDGALTAGTAGLSVHSGNYYTSLASGIITLYGIADSTQCTSIVVAKYYAVALAVGKDAENFAVCSGTFAGNLSPNWNSSVPGGCGLSASRSERGRHTCYQPSFPTGSGPELNGVSQ